MDHAGVMAKAQAFASSSLASPGGGKWQSGDCNRVLSGRDASPAQVRVLSCPLECEEPLQHGGGAGAW